MSRFTLVSESKADIWDLAFSSSKREGVDEEEVENAGEDRMSLGASVGMYSRTSKEVPDEELGTRR